MIITLKKEAKPEQIEKLIHRFENMDLKVTVIYGENYNVFGLVGDTSKVDEKNIMANPIVANVQRVDEPYKLVNRKFHPEDTIVDHHPQLVDAAALLGESIPLRAHQFLDAEIFACIHGHLLPKHWGPIRQKLR